MEDEKEGARPFLKLEFRACVTFVGLANERFISFITRMRLLDLLRRTVINFRYDN